MSDMETWRRENAEKIDIQTAPILRRHVYVLDPYGERELSDEERCIGAYLFVAAPGGGWKWEGDLSDEKRRALHERFNSGDDGWDDISF